MDYFDQLKSRTRRAMRRLDYDFDEYKTSKLVKLDILLCRQAYRRAFFHRA